MTTLQINSTVAPQQHVPDVKSYNVDSEALNGATKITLRSHQLNDSDSELADRFQREALQKSESIRLKAEMDEAESQARFESLYPSEKRRFVEEYWTPIIIKLTKSHESEFDQVTDFEDSEATFRTRLQAEYAFNLKHPDIQTRVCSGDYHFNEMLRNGYLNIEGYKLVERRSNGGGIQMVNDVITPAQGSSTLIYIPSSVPNLMAYANSDLALEYSKNEYERQLQRLIQKRKAAALALTKAKQSARDQLAAIPTFDDLISDSVKRATRK